MFGSTCMPLCSFFSATFAQWSVGARPAPGLPCALSFKEGEATKQDSGGMRREVANLCQSP